MANEGQEVRKSVVLSWVPLSPPTGHQKACRAVSFASAGHKKTEDCHSSLKGQISWSVVLSLEKSMFRSSELHRPLVHTFTGALIHSDRNS